MGQLPNLVEGVLRAKEANEASENAFFEAYPQLDKNNREHTDLLLRLGHQYRAVNPQASQEAFINEVGAMAMVSLKINPQPTTPQPPAEPTTEPHVPPAQAPVTAPIVEELNEFEELSTVDIDA
jgi:hypothetical protein